MNWMRAGVALGAAASLWAMNKAKTNKQLAIEIIRAEISDNIISCSYKDSAGKLYSAYQINNQWHDNATDELLPDLIGDKLTELCLIWARTNIRLQTRQLEERPMVIDAE